jgi:hypothetical protein
MKAQATTTEILEPTIISTTIYSLEVSNYKRVSLGKGKGYELDYNFTLSLTATLDSNVKFSQAVLGQLLGQKLQGMYKRDAQLKLAGVHRGLKLSKNGVWFVNLSNQSEENGITLVSDLRFELKNINDGANLPTILFNIFDHADDLATPIKLIGLSE